MKRGAMVFGAMVLGLLLTAGVSSADTISLWWDTTISGPYGDGTELTKLLTPFDNPCDGCDTLNLYLKYRLEDEGSFSDWDSGDLLYVEIKVGTTLGSATTVASTSFDPTGLGIKEENWSFDKPTIGAGESMWLVLYSDVNYFKEKWKFKEGHLTCEPVPIPGAAWLLLSGLVGIVGFRRKSSR